jgi:hypothetical protein
MSTSVEFGASPAAALAPDVETYPSVASKPPVMMAQV